MSFTTGCSLFQDNYKSFYLDSVPKSEDKVTMTPDLTVEHSFFDSIVKDVRSVTLETTDDILISRVDAIKLFGDNFLVADYKEGCVHMFDSAGYHVASIDNRGGGPGEYKRICGLDIDYVDSIIYILDGDLGKVQMYSKEMTLIEEVALPVRYADHMCVCGDILFLDLGFRGVYEDENGDFFDMIVYDLDKKKVIDKKFRYDSDMNVSFLMKELSVFSHFEDKMYYWRTLGNEIYSYQDSTLVESIEYDLLGREIPNDILGCDITKALERMEEEDYAYVDCFYEFDNWYYARISMSPSAIHYFYDKRTNKGYSDASFVFVTNEDVLLPNLFKLSDNTCCSYMYSDDYKMLNGSAATTIDYEDNPIIKIYYLK